MKPLRDWTVRYITPDGRKGKFLGPEMTATAAEAMQIAQAELDSDEPGCKVTSAYEGDFAKSLRLRRKEVPSDPDPNQSRPINLLVDHSRPVRHVAAGLAALADRAVQGRRQEVRRRAGHPHCQRQEQGGQVKRLLSETFTFCAFLALGLAALLFGWREDSADEDSTNN